MSRLVQSYAVSLAALALPGCVAWATGPVTIAAPEAWTGFASGVVAVLVGLGAPMLARAYATTPRVRRWIERAGDGIVATGAIVLLLALGSVLTAVVTPWTGATVDAWLAAPEEAIGVTWLDAYRWAAGAGLIPMLALVYGSITLQLRLACAWWSFVDQNPRPLWEAAAILGLCLLVGLPLYVLLPAEGPALWYGADVRGAWAEPWTAMRSGEPYVLDRLDGFISAPSFHAVFGGLLVRLWWNTPLAGLAIVLNAVMIVATWVVGEHYLVDIAVGLALVGGAMLAVDFATKEGR